MESFWNDWKNPVEKDSRPKSRAVPSKRRKKIADESPHFKLRGLRFVPPIHPSIHPVTYASLTSIIHRWIVYHVCMSRRRKHHEKLPGENYYPARSCYQQHYQEFALLWFKSDCWFGGAVSILKGRKVIIVDSSTCKSSIIIIIVVPDEKSWKKKFWDWSHGD